MISSIEGRQLIYGMVVVLLVTAIGLLLALQGWKSRPPATDMMIYIYNADAFLHAGAFPQYGDISSYGSFSMPGTSWLMVPGMLIFTDPRLFEKAGSALLHFGTLLGVFLLAHSALGSRPAYLSLVLYGLSAIGLSFAGSLWPIGHPFFYVWMAYFACYWLTRQDARYLAAAAVTWAFGMYVDMAITPAIMMLPALWLVYRPPVFGRHLLIGGVLILGLWYPYLHFEAGRGYVDMKSQLLRQSIAPVNYKDAWCNPGLSLHSWDDTSSQTRINSGTPPVSQDDKVTLLDRLLVRAIVIKGGLLANLIENTPVLAFSVALLLLLLTSVAVLGLAGLPPRVVKFVTGTRLLPGQTAAFIGRLKSQAIVAGRNPEKATAIVLCLLLPWLILLIVAEPGRSERFFWLWPLQVILLVAAVTSLLPRQRTSKIPSWTGQVALILLIVAPALLSSLGRGIQSGWAGSDAEEVQVVEYVANRLRAGGKDQAAIGYQIFIYPFMARYNIIDPHYKVGSEFDLLFNYRHGISNTNQCAEGVSPDDEYRIVQRRPQSPAWAPREYFDLSIGDNYRLLRQFGSYEVYVRD